MRTDDQTKTNSRIFIPQLIGFGPESPPELLLYQWSSVKSVVDRFRALRNLE